MRIFHELMGFEYLRTEPTLVTFGTPAVNLNIEDCPRGVPMITFTMHEVAGLRTDAQRVGITHVFSKENGFGDDALEAIREMLVRSAA